MNNLEKDMKEMIVRAGKEVLKIYGHAKIQYTKESKTSIVTQADLISHKILTETIKKKYPTHGIISEEDKNYKRNAEYVWILDPVDGTRNFASRTPWFSVIVALMKNNKIVMGAIYHPFFEELYFAEKGKGAYLNGKKITCSKKTDLGNTQGIMSIYLEKPNANFVKKLVAAQEKEKFWSISLSCIAMETTHVADGRRDWVFVPIAGGVWDYAAAYIILKESGCVVTNLRGKEWSLKDNEILAANPKLHSKLLKIINN